MKNIKDAERLAEETLKSIDGIEQVEVNDYLFTRIQSRIEMRKAANEPVNLTYLYKLAATLLFFTCINIIAFNYLTNKNQVNNNQKKNGIDAFAEDYSLNQNISNY